jgi:hypothetical protein
MRCSQCNATVNEALRYCPACGCDLGCPNVRVATSAEEVAALRQRYSEAEAQAVSLGLGGQFNSLVSLVSTESHVVVSMPPLVARNLLADPRELYSSYEKLLGCTRAPASSENDSKRFAVAGRLFGSYASDIRYGVLSLNEVGIANYGTVSLTLRDVAVRQRVSFLHENSYQFVNSFCLSLHDSIPPGYRSCWDDRAKLVATKLASELNPTSGRADWGKQLVLNGANRAGDRFVEAHIFGPFNAESVQSVTCIPVARTREERNDFACIREHMAKRTHPRGSS